MPMTTMFFVSERITFLTGSGIVARVAALPARSDESYAADAAAPCRPFVRSIDFEVPIEPGGATKSSPEQDGFPILNHLPLNSGAAMTRSSACQPPADPVFPAATSFGFPKPGLLP
jgi:hypothetical protein